MNLHINPALHHNISLVYTNDRLLFYVPRSDFHCRIQSESCANR